MHERVEQQTLQGRFPLLTGLAMFICFILFPLFLIDAALNRVLQIKHEKSLHKTRHKLEKNLDVLERCSNNRHFAHLLLKHAFRSALKSGNPALLLEKNLSRLKQRYPGVFFFVAWDDKGRIIKNITDETSFAYILRETHSLLRDLAENCQRYYPGAPSKIPGFDRRLKMVRHYLGRVISTEWVQRPLQAGKLASAIVAEPDGVKSHVWYDFDKRISMLAFIHSDFFVGQPGLEFAIRRLQAINPEIRAGYTSYPIDTRSVYQRDDTTRPGDIAIAINKFENMHPGNLLIENNIVLAYRFISPEIRAYCHTSEANLFSIETTRKKLIGTAFKWLIILMFFAIVLSMKQQLNFVPVRLKLVGLFLYGGGIPLLIIFIIGADYLQQKRQELIYAEQSHSLEILRQIDEGFVDFLNQTGKEVQQMLQLETDILADPTGQRDRLSLLRNRLIEKFQPGSIMLFDKSGKSMISGEGNLPFPDPTAVSQISKELLEFLNQTSSKNFALSPLALPMATELISKAGKINSFLVGNNETYAFYDYIGHREKYASNGFFYAFWPKEDMQRRYLEQAMLANPALCAYFTESVRYLRKNVTAGGQLGKMLQKAESLLVVRQAELINNGEISIAAAIYGSNLHKSCLSMLVPVARIDARMRQLFINYVVLSAIFLFFCAGGILMMKHRLLSPLHLFKEAIEAIGLRNFRFRLDDMGTNEFGKLGKALNHTLENLSELEVARIVQENLLPGREFRQNKLELLAELKQMSHIGGDYYDFFAIDDETTGVFIGDVSGHGISAALFMAMARSAVVFENFSQPEQMRLMQRLNQIMHTTRQSGAREYMTGLSLSINSKNGEFSILSAGHCPPILIRAGAKTFERLSCKGIYLGFREDFTAQPCQGKLENGDYLILYTDSWVESLSKSGVPFGFSRLEQALLSCCNRDLELFSQQMFASICNWEAERQDDMTLLIIRFGDSHGG